MAEEVKPVSAETVRADFNDPVSVVHYSRAAHCLGLWKSERALIQRFFPDRTVNLLEAGCGAGRATLGLWQMGYRRLTAFCPFTLSTGDEHNLILRRRGRRLQPSPRRALKTPAIGPNEGEA